MLTVNQQSILNIFKWMKRLYFGQKVSSVGINSAVPAFDFKDISINYHHWHIIRYFGLTFGTCVTRLNRQLRKQHRKCRQYEPSFCCASKKKEKKNIEEKQSQRHIIYKEIPLHESLSHVIVADFPLHFFILFWLIGLKVVMTLFFVILILLRHSP